MAPARLEGGDEILTAFARLFEHSPDGAFLTRPEGAILWANAAAAAMLGHDVEALARLDRRGVTVPDARLEALLAERERAGVGRGEITFVRADGSNFPADVTSLLFPAAGATYGCVLFRDATDRRRHEAELEGSREQLRALAARLDSVREEEQKRIAQDLHDDLGQLLTGLQMELQAMERDLSALPLVDPVPGLLDRAVAASELVRQTTEALRRVAVRLRPPVLDLLGLGAALRQEGKDFSRRSGIACAVHVGEPLEALDGELATALFRIAQESLTNVGRHANAQHVTLTAAFEGDTIVLRVEDDGRGLPREAVRQRALGVVGMTERATRLGGTLVLGPGAGGGTAVVARIPLLRR